uniref:Iron-sulfur protein NUBPL n=2 Tax=Cacopsylla melanoneura TaxID=428564 RepID=A0A8D8ZJH2_9HEMI
MRLPSTMFMRFKSPTTWELPTSMMLQRVRHCSMTDHQQKLMSKNLPKRKPIEGVKKIVMIASSKGGVGKSTTTVNLATATKLCYPDKEVGILDADVFGPSIPILMNLPDTPLLNKENLMIPLVNYGVKCMSMGNLITEKSAAIWRGLMVMQALKKLTEQVQWGPCDILFIDTPPGTGDTHLSLIQTLPIDAAVIITIPDTLSLQVAQRGYTMFKKLNIPVAGLVMNMNTVLCPSCKHSFELYENRLNQFDELNELPLLENIPMSKDVKQCTHTHVPVVISHPKSEVSQIYSSLGHKIVNFVELKQDHIQQ